MSSVTPSSIFNTLKLLEKLPGIGPRGAARIVFNLLQRKKTDTIELSNALKDLVASTKNCKYCFHFTDSKICCICENIERDPSKILVIEHPQDLIAIETSGQFNGVYHVLSGKLDILGGVKSGDLTAKDLIERIDDSNKNVRKVQVKEVILGLNATWEGDSTGLWLYEELHNRNIKITRLARGISPGGTLEMATAASLADALHGRQDFSPGK